jgi:uncharacterized protein
MADINIGEQVKQIAIKYAEVLKKEYTIHSLYLYGSYAKGNYNSDSDIDIAIIADGLSGDIVEDTFKLMKYRRTVDNRIEPHPFLTDEFNVNNPAAREIMETGIRVI